MTPIQPLSGAAFALTLALFMLSPLAIAGVAFINTGLAARVPRRSRSSAAWPSSPFPPSFLFHRRNICGCA